MARPMPSGSASHPRAEPSPSASNSVTVPVGNRKSPSPTGGSPHCKGRVSTATGRLSLTLTVSARSAARTSAISLILGRPHAYDPPADHQARRVALDTLTLAVLSDLRARAQQGFARI